MKGARRTSKRTICFPLTSRIHYARQKHLLRLIKAHPKLELMLVAGGSLLLEKYGERFFSAIEKDGFSVCDVIYNVIEGGNHITMAKTAGLTALEFANSLYKLNPSIVLVRGDRFEQLAIAMVAAYLNKTIAHIEGGDVTGTIDESVRHAITKLAHIHFVTNEDARRRVLRMGENPRRVFNVGSPDVEFAASVPRRITGDEVNRSGLGYAIDVRKPFLMVMQHPVTTETENRSHIETTLRVVDAFNISTVFFWPNSDAGTAEMAKGIRIYRETGKLKNGKIHFVTDLLPEHFIALLRRASVLIGNSSAGIKECSYLGVPVVNIGTRQNGRLRAANVLDVGYGEGALRRAIARQLAHGPYPASTLYYRPDTSRRMAEILARVPLTRQKTFYERNR